MFESFESFEPGKTEKAKCPKKKKKKKKKKKRRRIPPSLRPCRKRLVKKFKKNSKTIGGPRIL